MYLIKVKSKDVMYALYVTWYSEEKLWNAKVGDIVINFKNNVEKFKNNFVKLETDNPSINERSNYVERQKLKYSEITDDDDVKAVFSFKNEEDLFYFSLKTGLEIIEKEII